MIRPRLTLVMLSLGAIAGCGGDNPSDPGLACTAIAVASLNVTVLDQATGARLCDATVVAAEGPFEERLALFGAGADCSYGGPFERAGVYEVRASSSGYRSVTVRDLRVGRDECHVIPVQVSVPLSR